jgi:hypothetical protein
MHDFSNLARRLVSNESFGEPVSITDSNGVIHAGQAMIERFEPQTAPEAPGGAVRLHQARIMLVDDAESYLPPFTGGTLGSLLDENRWRVTFPLERNATAKSYPISHRAPARRGMVIL